MRIVILLLRDLDEEENEPFQLREHSATFARCLASSGCHPGQRWKSSAEFSSYFCLWWLSPCFIAQKLGGER